MAGTWARWDMIKGSLIWTLWHPGLKILGVRAEISGRIYAHTSAIENPAGAPIMLLRNLDRVEVKRVVKWGCIEARKWRLQADTMAKIKQSLSGYHASLKMLYRHLCCIPVVISSGKHECTHASICLLGEEHMLLLTDFGLKAKSHKSTILDKYVLNVVLVNNTVIHWNKNISALILIKICFASQTYPKTLQYWWRHLWNDLFTFASITVNWSVLLTVMSDLYKLKSLLNCTTRGVQLAKLITMYRSVEVLFAKHFLDLIWMELASRLDPHWVLCLYNWLRSTAASNCTNGQHVVLQWVRATTTTLSCI